MTSDGIEEGDVLELRIEEGVLRDLTKGTEKRFNPLSAMMGEHPRMKAASCRT